MVTHTPSVVKSRVVDVSGIDTEMCTFTSSEPWITSVSGVGLGDLVTVEVERDRSSARDTGVPTGSGTFPMCRIRVAKYEVRIVDMVVERKPLEG
jgi:hypothetical protein